MMTGLSSPGYYESAKRFFSEMFEKFREYIVSMWKKSFGRNHEDTSPPQPPNIIEDMIEKSQKEFNKGSIEDMMVNTLGGVMQKFIEDFMSKYLEENMEKYIEKSSEEYIRKFIEEDMPKKMEEIMLKTMEDFMKKNPTKPTATKTQSNNPKLGSVYKRNRNAYIIPARRNRNAYTIPARRNLKRKE